MAAQTEPEVILYDLACTKNVCFSPAVWRIRLMLNYKHIPYRTIFLEFPDIEPTLKGLGIHPPAGPSAKYTVPAIHHVPSDTYMMDSTPIADFLESTYPHPPVALTPSDLGASIEARARAAVGAAFRASLAPREIHILSPRAQAYFRRTREAALGGLRLEELLDGEEGVWGEVGEEMKAVGELMRTNRAEGPFVMGARPCGTDFFIAGALGAARVVDEGVWRRCVGVSGFGEVYEACAPWMERED